MASFTSPDQPLRSPPPGQISNFVNPPDTSSEVFITASICIPLILVFASLRYWAKAFVVKQWWTWDDLTCALGVIATLGYTGVTCAAAVGKVYGLHEWDVTWGTYLNLNDQSVPHIRIAFIGQCLYPISIWFVKNSLFVLYFHIFTPVRAIRIQAICGIIITAAFYITILAANVSVCAPKNGQSEVDFATSLHGPKCVHLGHKVSLALGVVNLVLDLYLMVLPLPTIWMMRMPLKKKIGVSMMFLTGTIACVASMVCLYFRTKASQLEDTTWSIIPIFVLTIIEMSAGIIVCCMPTAAAVFKRYKTPVMSRFSIHKHSRRISSREADQTPIYAGTAANHANIVSGGRKWPTIKNISSTQTMSPNKEDVIQLAPSDITVTMSVDMTRNEKT